VIRSALLPLSIQQSKSAEYMKALKPYVADIKTKFKGNDEAITRATGKLYEDANQNPLAGCLVSLAQLPIFLGLYRGVRELALEDQLNEPFLWIPSLEGPVTAPDYQGLDWLVQGWTKAAADSDSLLPLVPPLGWETTLAFLIMPVVLVVLQSVTMRALQPPVDEYMSDEEKKQMETTQQVFKFLPLLIGVFSLQVPAGLTIYWFTSNIFTLSQSLGVKAYFAANPPQVELPEYWDTALTGDGKDMSPEERRKAAQAGLRVGPSFDDLVDESRFHVRIERPSLRSAVVEVPYFASPLESPTSYPQALQEWVQSGGRQHGHATEPTSAATVATSVAVATE
jgi:YidC/Oxa1 family membrane protein insertase